MNYPSKLVEEAVDAISKLPGIGKKTALRLVLYLLKQPKEDAHALSDAITKLREGIKYCADCHVISDTTDCTCKNMHTDESIICVVEDTPDVLAIRSTGQYNGMFHVLGEESLQWMELDRKSYTLIHWSGELSNPKVR